MDEIGTEAEALACRSIAERGVQLVGTAHGQLLENLIKVSPAATAAQLALEGAVLPLNGTVYDGALLRLCAALDGLCQPLLTLWFLLCRTQRCRTSSVASAL